VRTDVKAIPFGQPVVSRSPEETQALARHLVGLLPGRAVLALHGGLGSGKTCFVSGLAAALGINAPITSPTFTVVNEYRAGRPLYHIDLYRLSGPDEAFALGLDEYLDTDGITAIEWAERAAELMPRGAIHIDFRMMPDANQRSVTISMNPGT
jgi:tRNA threonylcarbamoyladenosine biosynthesis protein TsaE